ncbi:transposase [Candidatus Daviesbacteria bacterium]|nr:transposase [Candidatus Daviesbacteria bacterium]
MPCKNSLKQYTEKGYYHIYNRGVEKRAIFQDIQDYLVFLSYLKNYLLPKEEEKLKEKLSDLNTSYKEKDNIIKLLQLNNFADEITLLAFCLMPNHFHFAIKQKSAGSIDKFMNSLATRYSMYFNRKYKRVGPLYQGVYKAVLVTREEQLLHLTRYIHKQALALQGLALERGLTEQPSSYLDYVGKRKTEWVKPEEILAYFSQTNPKFSYEAFVKQQDDFNVISRVILEKI